MRLQIYISTVKPYSKLQVTSVSTAFWCCPQEAKKQVTWFAGNYAFKKRGLGR